MSERDRVRLSDAEREQAAQALGDHFAAGRLSSEEHAERHEQVFAAQTYGDLPPLFADLPGGSPLHPTQPRTAGPMPGPWGRSFAQTRRPPVWALAKAGLLALIVVSVVTHLPLIVFGVAVFVLLKLRGARRRHAWLAAQFAGGPRGRYHGWAAH